MKVHGSAPSLGFETHNFECFADEEADVDDNQAEADQVQEGKGPGREAG